MSFMDRVIHWSLKNRLVVVIGALALSLYGAVVAVRMPVDVLPDLTAPTVTILTEAHGLAPQEVETLVTIPIASAVNGATSVRRVRSSSSIGYSIVWVEFEWDTDLYIARQIVNEKLQLVASQIPPDLGPPTLAPISSIIRSMDARSGSVSSRAAISAARLVWIWRRKIPTRLPNASRRLFIFRS